MSEKEKRSYRSFGICCVVLGIVFVWTGCCFELGFESVFVIIVGIFFLVLSLVNLWSLCVKLLEEKKRKKAYREAHPLWREEEFYQACVARGIKNSADFDSIAGESTAKEIAGEQKLSKNIEDLKKLFDIGAAEDLRKKEEQKAQAQRKAQQQEAERQQKRLWWLSSQEAADQLYELAAKNGVTDISSSANCARLQLLAEQNDIPLTPDELQSVFTRGKEKVDAREKQSRIEEAQQAENAVISSHLKYKNFVGRKKRIQMYTDEAALHQEKSEAYYDRYVSLVRHSVRLADLSAEKEKDWALAGGIASGIAGSGAGIATALNVQRENEQIRARNAANQAAILGMTSGTQEHCHSQSVREEEIAKKLLKKAEEAKMKLVEELPQEELLTYLSLKTVSVKGEETGSKRITISLTPKYPLLIYENVRAVIDGSFKVILLNKTTHSKLGETIICLGKDGAVANEKIETFLPNISEEDTLCEVVFEPNHLWAIEI